MACGTIGSRVGNLSWHGKLSRSDGSLISSFCENRHMCPSPALQPRFPADFRDRALGDRPPADGPVPPASCVTPPDPAALRAPWLSNVEACGQVRLHPDWSSTGAALRLKGIGPWRRPWPGAEAQSSPPLDRAIVRALACETVAQTGLPLSRQSLTDLALRAQVTLGRPSVAARSGGSSTPTRSSRGGMSTGSSRAIRRFAPRAGRVLDFYAGLWEGERLDAEDRILSSDEETSIQARSAVTSAYVRVRGVPGALSREYRCAGGALQYLATRGVQEGRVMGRCEARTGIVPVERLVRQVMDRPEYRRAARVFWVVDNGSSHRGEAAAAEGLSQRDPGAPAGACQLAESDRDLLLVDSKEGPHAQ